MPWCQPQQSAFWTQIRSGWTQEHRQRIHEFPGNDNKNPHTHTQLTETPTIICNCNTGLHQLGLILGGTGPDRLMWYWCSGTSVSICVVLIKQRYFLSTLHIFPLWTDLSFANLESSDTITARVSTWLRFSALCHTGIHLTCTYLTLRKWELCIKQGKGFKGSLPNKKRCESYATAYPTQQSTDMSDSTLLHHHHHHEQHDIEWVKKGVRPLQ